MLIRYKSKVWLKNGGTKLAEFVCGGKITRSGRVAINLVITIDGYTRADSYYSPIEEFAFDDELYTSKAIEKVEFILKDSKLKNMS